MEEERKKAEDEAKRRMVEERRAFAEARKSMVNMLPINKYKIFYILERTVGHSWKYTYLLSGGELDEKIVKTHLYTISVH